MFKGWLIDKIDGKQSVAFTDIDEANLPEGDVRVRVAYSTINYKDALALTGKGPVVRHFPMVPGVDLAGHVETSSDPAFKPGDEVFLNGWGVGETHWGGLAELASLKAAWLLKPPTGLSLRQIMALGTAGYTAMLAIMALEKHGLKPGDGPILVTGASGGVGGFSISFLATLGFQVIASTGRLQETDYLKSLGASEIIDRAELASPGKPLGRERWAGAIDSVGGHTLANVCASTRYEGAVAACGLAQGMDFPATVAPFILRGVTLYGIDSVYRTNETRRVAWDRIANVLNRQQLDLISHERPLAQALQTAEDLFAGAVRGRVIITIGS
ncbi:MDR family oxidoreductase [Beijerinckia indica]|uniref:Quinone oxidoreductase, YhdH/YhfP family n=1 Tax=Beijerinckia indica subsp. indica (strain ATCC 9039 / DSM 1715 / NCIMB 8712) TaxID=395963 RepID=B2II13_BEII9|nr:MDR family oxidoreductase [Beijerinckia indica]ACB94596.1 quinone oxidoreductase, YhdH/YhfP family [Beijerinckia indica subsp. indica ATCC 9039]